MPNNFITNDGLTICPLVRTIRTSCYSKITRFFQYPSVNLIWDSRLTMIISSVAVPKALVQWFDEEFLENGIGYCSDIHALLNYYYYVVILLSFLFVVSGVKQHWNNMNVNEALKCVQFVSDFYYFSKSSYKWKINV